MGPNAEVTGHYKPALLVPALFEMSMIVVDMRPGVKGVAIFPELRGNGRKQPTIQYSSGPCLSALHTSVTWKSLAVGAVLVP